MLEPFDPFFVEEPVPPENTDAMAMLQRSTNMPIATGEACRANLISTHLEKRPPAFCSRTRPTGQDYSPQEIAAMADAHYVTIAPHNPMAPCARPPQYTWLPPFQTL
jgi:galactonate dehydratase